MTGKYLDPIESFPQKMLWALYDHPLQERRVIVPFLQIHWHINLTS